MAKRSSRIDFTFVSAVAAAALAGCNAQTAYHRDWEQCVDQRNMVVADQFCDPNGATATGVPYRSYYHWWYSSRPYMPGSFIDNGYARPVFSNGIMRASSAPASPSGGGATSSGGTIRGGFGASAHGGVGT